MGKNKPNIGIFIVLTITNVLMTCSNLIVYGLKQEMNKEKKEVKKEVLYKNMKNIQSFIETNFSHTKQKGNK